MKSNKKKLTAILIGCVFCISIFCAFSLPFAVVSAESTDRFNVQQVDLPDEITQNGGKIPEGFYDSYTDKELPSEINATNILTVIPMELIVNYGYFFYSGKEYSFVLETSHEEHTIDRLVTRVMVFYFETEKNVSQDLTDAAFYVHAKIALNATIYGGLHQAPETTLRTETPSNFALQNVKINNFLYNTNQPNVWEDTYDKNDDKGYYFTAASYLMQADNIGTVNDPFEVLASEIVTVLGFIPGVGPVIELLDLLSDVVGSATTVYNLVESNSYSMDFVDDNQKEFRRNLLFELNGVSNSNNVLHSVGSYIKTQVVLNKQDMTSVAEMKTRISYSIAKKQIVSGYDIVESGVEYQTSDMIGTANIADGGDFAIKSEKIDEVRPTSGVVLKNEKNNFNFSPLSSGNYRIDTDTNLNISVKSEIENELNKKGININATKGKGLNLIVKKSDGSVVEKVAGAYPLQKGETYQIEVNNIGEDLRVGAYKLSAKKEEIALGETAEIVDLTRVDLSSLGFDVDGIGYRANALSGMKITAASGVTVTLYRDGQKVREADESIYAIFEDGYTYVLTLETAVPKTVTVQTTIETATQNVVMEVSNQLRIYTFKVSSTGAYTVKATEQGARLFGADGDVTVSLDNNKNISLTAGRTYYIEVPAGVEVTIQKQIALNENLSVNYTDISGTYALFVPSFTFDYLINSTNSDVAFLDENLQPIVGSVLQANTKYYIWLPAGEYSLTVALNDTLEQLQLNTQLTDKDGYYRFTPTQNGVYSFLTDNVKVYNNAGQSISPVSFADGFYLLENTTYYIEGGASITTLYGRLTAQTDIESSFANGSYSYYNDTDQTVFLVFSNTQNTNASGRIVITVGGVSKTFDFNDNSLYLASATVQPSQLASIEISSYSGNALTFAPQDSQPVLDFGESDIYVDKDALFTFTFNVPSSGKFSFTANSADVTIEINGVSATGYVSLSSGAHTVTVSSALNGQNVRITVALQTQTITQLFNEITQTEQSGWYVFNAATFNNFYGAMGYSVYSDAQSVGVYNENLVLIPHTGGIVFESKNYYVNLVISGQSGKVNFNLTADYQGILSQSSGRTAIADQDGNALLGVEKIFSLQTAGGLYTLNITKENGEYLSNYTLRFYDNNGMSVTVTNIDPSAPYYTYFVNENADYRYVGITVNASEKAYVSVDDESIETTLFTYKDMRHYLKYAFSLGQACEVSFQMPSGKTLIVYSSQNGAQSVAAGEFITLSANVTYYIYDKSSHAVAGYSFAILPKAKGELSLSQKRNYAVDAGMNYYSFTPTESAVYYVNIPNVTIYRESNGNISEIVNNTVNMTVSEKYYFEFQSATSGMANLQLVKSLPNLYLEREGGHFSSNFSAAAGDVYRIMKYESGIYQEIDFDYYNLQIVASSASISANKIKISNQFLSGSFALQVNVANYQLNLVVTSYNEITDIQITVSGSDRYTLNQNSDVLTYTMEAYENFTLTPKAYNRNGIELSQNYSYVYQASKSAHNAIWQNKNEALSFVKAQSGKLNIYLTDALLHNEKYVVELRYPNMTKEIAIVKSDVTNFDTVYDLRSANFASSYNVTSRKVQFLLPQNTYIFPYTPVTINSDVEYIDLKSLDNKQSNIFGFAFIIKSGENIHIRSNITILGGGTERWDDTTLFRSERTNTNLYLYTSMLLGGRGYTGQKATSAVYAQHQLNIFVPVNYTGWIGGGTGGDGQDGYSAPKIADYSPSTYGNGKNGENGIVGGNGLPGGSGAPAIVCRSLYVCHQGQLKISGGSGGAGGDGGKGQDGQNGQTGASGPGLITSGGRGGNGGNGGNGGKGGNGAAPIEYLQANYKGKLDDYSPYNHVTEFLYGGSGGAGGTGGGVGAAGRGGYSNAAWGITGVNGKAGTSRGSNGGKGSPCSISSDRLFDEFF